MAEDDKLKLLARQSRALWGGSERRYGGRLSDHTAQSRAILPAPCGGRHTLPEPGTPMDCCVYCGGWKSMGHAVGSSCREDVRLP